MIDESRQFDPAFGTDPNLETLAAEIADEFTERLAQGERPDVDDYAKRHPEIAAVLRELLPALRLMHQSGSGILRDSVDDGGTAGNVANAAVSGRLGDYRLLEEIGRGGMGVVYEAEQISLGRRVALKVLPFAAALDSKQLERFKREAQAAAHLHHTNIVPVYAVGCERGVYYYAMQFIEGQSLSEVIAELRELSEGDDDRRASVRGDCDADGRDDGVLSDAVTRLFARGKAEVASVQCPPRRERPFPEDPSTCDDSDEDDSFSGAEFGSANSAFVETSPAQVRTQTYAAMSTQQSIRSPTYFRSIAMLGAQAADALDHAHGQGIVHRDIKPANLLVDARAHLWVTDFGLARYQTDGNLTRTGDMVGTLRYMSPEQALGHRTVIDHRTDIYSLGATLYELLTTRPVWDGGDRSELLRQIAFNEPVPPRKWNPRIPVDLQNIVLKALSREAPERYATAGLLADDLRRFLEDKPVLARRPSWRDRTAKWARRHRGAVTTAVLLLVCAVIGLTVSNILIARAQQDTKRALRELNAKQDMLEHEQVETKKALAAEARERERAEWNFQQARRMLGVFIEISEVDLARAPDVQDVRRKLLESALQYHQEFLEQSGDDPAAQAEIAESLFRLASIFNEIDAKPDALAAFEQAREVQEKLAREHPDDPDIQLGLFAIYRHLGVLRGSGGISVLSQDSVRKHLKLTEAQIASIDEFAEERRRNFFEYRRENHSRKELHALFERHALEGRQLIAEVLSASQSERLEQISLQMRGTQAFDTPEIAQALRLSEAQLQRIRELNAQAYRELRELFRSGRNRRDPHRRDRFRDDTPQDDPQSGEEKQGGDQVANQDEKQDADRNRNRDLEIRKRFRDTRRTTNDTLLSVLTTEQMTRWREMAGEPFNGELRLGYHGGRRRGHHRGRVRTKRMSADRDKTEAGTASEAVEMDPEES